MMHNDAYLRQLQIAFETHKNAENAQYQKAYLRNQFEFLGIKTPLLRQILQSFGQEYDFPNRVNLAETLKKIYDLPYREYQHVAIEILTKFRKKLLETDLDLLEYFIVRHAWWDTVDALAHLVGDYFRVFPQYKLDRTQKWLNLGNMWLQRVAIIFQIAYKQQTDADLLFANILQMCDSQEFFIQKAIGWALREYGKTAPDKVKEFVTENASQLAPLSKREALRRIIG
jgi:3-methyladenine DNA glycosylase AlkD